MASSISVILLLGGLIFLVAGIYLRWNIYALLLWLTGRAHGCPLSAAFSAITRDQSHKRKCAVIDSKIRLLEKDDSLDFWDTPAGRYWIPQRSASRGSLSDELAERDDEIYGGNLYGVRKSDVVIDCGASVGVFVREALDHGASRVVAVEPSPQNVKSLKKTFQSEIAEGRVILYQKGMWHEDAVLPMRSGDSPAADTFVFVNEWQNAEELLPLTTIDSMAAELGLESVDFIKMDIEGAEQNALRGAQKTIARFRPRLAISAYHLKTDPDEIPAIVRAVDKNYTLRCNSCRYIFDGYLHSALAPLVYLFLPQK